MRAVKDADLLELSGSLLEPALPSGRSYLLGDVIGEGAHGVVFRARRQMADGAAQVVVKVLRPRAVRELSGLASASLEKEVAALRRLSEGNVTAHVVKFFDVGLLRIGDRALELPWLAAEYVDGGAEGVTLRARVEASVARTGFAFDAGRALRLVHDVCSGLSSVHQLAMIHRDIGPSNVLCTAGGRAELFKIADFGLARVSSAATFGNVLFGTPGYCAPEQSFPDKVGAGPYSDVFATACTVFFALTGQPYFAATTIPETLVAVYAPERRRLLDAPGLDPELRARPENCAELDQILAQATRSDARERLQSASELADRLVPLLSPA